MIQEQDLPSIEEFNLNPLFLGVFKESNIRGIYNKIYWMQRFKMISNKDLYRVLRTKEKLEKVEDINCFRIDRETLANNTKVYKAYATYGVFIQFTSKTSLTAICRMDKDFDKSRFELQFASFSINYIYITEYDFIELVNGKQRDCNYMLLFRRILAEAIIKKATDVCFEVIHYGVEPKYTVTCKVDIRHIPLLDFELDKDTNENMLKEVISQKTYRRAMDIEQAGNGGLDVSVIGILNSYNKNLVLRLSAHQCYDGYTYTYRIQDPKTTTLKVKELGFGSDVVNNLNNISKRQGGLTLITGPIRSGKNTTQFAMANDMYQKEIRMMSYESPIETMLPFTQCDYKGDINVLKELTTRAKKQALNVALLNEIPTADVAFAVRDLVNASVHVITTLHINRIWNLPQKLEEYFGNNYKSLLMQLNGVFNQKMFGIQCKKCAKKKTVENIKDKQIRDILYKNGVTMYYENDGCNECVEGNLPGKVQPYVEYIMFNNDLKITLTKCSSPAEMEIELFNYVYDNQLNMEISICKAIAEGRLRYDALYLVL